MLVNLIFSGFLSSFYKQYKLKYITLLEQKVQTTASWCGHNTDFELGHLTSITVLTYKQLKG